LYTAEYGGRFFIKPAGKKLFSKPIEYDIILYVTGFYVTGFYVAG
jgi:hypothetical protein